MDVIVHYPKTADKQTELAKSVAKLHAESIVRYIEKLNCPADQKLALIDSIIATVKNK